MHEAETDQTLATPTMAFCRSASEAGIVGYQFGVPGVSDGISMGTTGMSFSLQSRDLIADCVETVASGHWLDGMVVVPVSRPSLFKGTCSEDDVRHATKICLGHLWLWVA